MANNNNNNSDTSKLLIFSDTLGCPEKTNKKSFYLSNVLCRPLFFKSINKFMGKNDDNSVAFIGNFFDKGKYVMTNIIQILKLKNEEKFNERVHIILSYREIQKLRFRFELDKVLLKQGIYEYPEKDDLEIKKTYIPIDIIVDDNFDKIRTKRYINAVYQRIIDILTQTHDCKMSECVLMHECLFKSFKNARRQGYLELIIMLQQLGSLILVYPFLQVDRWETFLSKEEVKLMIQFLVKNIKLYYEEYCKLDSDGEVRSDPMKKELQKNLSNIYGIIEIEGENYKTYQTDKLPPIDVWDQLCNSFYNNGKLMIHDEKYQTLLCHDYALIDFFRLFRICYILIVKDDDIEKLFEMTNEKDSIKWTHALYYYKMNYYYKLYDFCYNLIIINKEKNIDKIKKLVDEKKEELHILLCNEKAKKEKTLYLDYTDTVSGKNNNKLQHVTINKKSEFCLAKTALTKVESVNGNRAEGEAEGEAAAGAT